MAYVTAYIAMADIVMGTIVMAYIVMAYIYIWSAQLWPMRLWPVEKKKAGKQGHSKATSHNSPMASVLTSGSFECPAACKRTTPITCARPLLVPLRRNGTGLESDDQRRRLDSKRERKNSTRVRI